MLLGKGAYGLVIGCKNEDGTKANIAVKIMKYSAAQYDEEKGFTGVKKVCLKDLKQELKVLEVLRGTNSRYIPEYYGCVHDESSKAVYIVQEQLDQNLNEYIKQSKSSDKNNRFPLLMEENFETTVGMMLQMAQAVEIIHES